MRWLVVLLPLAACGADDGPPVIDELACNHLQTGPFQDVTLGDTRDSSAPDLDDSIVYRVGEASAGGFAAFGADGAAIGLYLTTDVTIEITDPAGAVVVPAEDDPSSTACGEIGRRVVIPTELGVYYVELGAGAAELVIVGEPAAEH